MYIVNNNINKIIVRFFVIQVYMEKEIRKRNKTRKRGKRVKS